MGEIKTIHEHSADLPLVELRHIFLSGTVCEPPEIAGVGRIALRWLRRGAAGRDRRGLDEAIDRIAAIISVQASPDYYTIHLRMLRRYLDRANDLLAQILLQPILDDGELERLKRETIAEIITSRDDDRYLASRAMRAAIYAGHPYGIPSRGSLETVARITREDVLGFLKVHLVQSHVLVGASGDIDQPTLAATLDHTIGKLPDRPGPVIDLQPATPHRGLKVVLVDKPERLQTQIHIGHLGPPIHDPQDLPLRVALTAFGGTFTSRLMREVRVERGWSYGAYASLGRGRVPEILDYWFFPALKDAVPCIELVKGLHSELKHQGLPEEEVLFARDYMAKSMALQQDTASARLTLLLRQEIFGLPSDYYATLADRLRQVTPAQATQATADHLNDQDLVIAMTCTADQIMEPLRNALGDEAEITVIPYDSPDL
jgi:zinc protease